MMQRLLLPFIVCVGLFLWLRFGLDPTGWLFYELYHATGVDAVYWGYRVFRGGEYLLAGWPYRTAACLLLAGLLFAFFAWRRRA